MTPDVKNTVVTTNLIPSKTWKLDFDRNKITNQIDKIEAVKQAVFLILSTERGCTKIYENYGVKFSDLIGQDFYLVVSELKRRVREALLEDDRITDVINFTFEEGELDSMTIKFEVVSIYGNFNAEGVYNLE